MLAFSGFGVPLASTTPVFYDNESSIQIARNNAIHQWTKHNDIDCDLHHHLLQGSLQLYFIPSNDQPTGFFTKSHPRCRFHDLVSKLKLVSHPPPWRWEVSAPSSFLGLLYCNKFLVTVLYYCTALYHLCSCIVLLALLSWLISLYIGSLYIVLFIKQCTYSQFLPIQSSNFLKPTWAWLPNSYQFASWSTWRQRHCTIKWCFTRSFIWKGKKLMLGSTFQQIRCTKIA